MKTLTITLGFGALAAWLLTKKAQSAAPTGMIVEKNGHRWELVDVPNPPGVVGANTTNVFAPAGSWGPHQRMLVLSFYVAVVPNAPRVLSGVGAGVPVQMRDAAMKDLAITVPGA